MAEYEACIMGLKIALDLDVHELLVMGYSDLLIRQAQGEWETRDIKRILYRQCVQDLSKRFKSIEFKCIPRFHNELAEALATLASMLPYPGSTHIDPLQIQIQNQHGYCNTIEIKTDGEPWYHDIKRFLKIRTPDLNLLRCIDATEAERIMTEVHKRIHGDLIHSPPSELYPMSYPCPFIAWEMDVIGPIEPKASNGHRFILVAIDYFTKWVEAVTFKAVTKKVVVDFIHSNIRCRFGIPKTIITNNASNLNSHLMKEECKQFKIVHRHSTPTGLKPMESLKRLTRTSRRSLGR
ncbi:uncharacterized protein [Nicotiana tomentosiformis]|uniref:uncharacterized protein n=1 Tax=Nicotiana tomentosiformis TaxID=4098 RepID=UPI00388C756C